MKKRSAIASLQKIPFHWLLPAFLVLGFVYLIPIFDVVRMSFTNEKIGNQNYEYTLDNYTYLFTSDTFYDTIIRTLVFVLSSVLFQVIIGLLIALAVNAGEKLRMRGTVLIRTICMVSMVIPGVVIGIIWNLIYMESPNGLLTYYLGLFGFEDIKFLTDPQNAMICAVIANVWRGTTSSMILIYAALKTISDDIVEAAVVDGATAIQSFLFVKLPSIANMILIVVFLGIVGTINTFDMIMTLTAGGPGNSTEVLSLSIYRRIFSDLNLSGAATLAVLMMLINFSMAFIYFKLTKKVED